MEVLKFGKAKEKERSAQQNPFDVEKSRKGIELLNKIVEWLQPVRKDVSLIETHLDGIFSYQVK